MVRNRRHVELSSGLYRVLSSLDVPQGSLQLVECVGCSFDTEPINKLTGWDERMISRRHAVMTVVLEGVYTAEDSSGSLEESAGSMCFEVREDWRELWTGSRLRLLVLCWNDLDHLEDGSLGKSAQQLGPVALERWRRIGRRLQRDALSSQEQRVLFRSALEAARAEGVDPAQIKLEEAPAMVRAMARKRNELFCNLHRQPQLLDLQEELGLSARQLRRLWKENVRWLGGAGFRKSLSKVRLAMASSLLEANQSSGAEVARALGYSCDRALYTALRNAGIPRR